MRNRLARLRAAYARTSRDDRFDFTTAVVLVLNATGAAYVHDAQMVAALAVSLFLLYRLHAARQAHTRAVVGASLAVLTLCLGAEDAEVRARAASVSTLLDTLTAPPPRP